MRRAIASLFTLGLLGTFLLTVVLGLMLAFGTIDLGVAVAVVVLINLATLFFGPWVNDFLYGWLYDLEWIDPAELRDRSPESARVIDEVTDEYGYEPPRMGIIPDRNPTAFTYGSTRSRSRIVLTEGCFEYLDDDELASVVAHELGHVTSRDFIIMTVANTIVQLLYLIAVHAQRIAASGRASSSKKGNVAGVLFGVAVLSYVLWFVGEYAVLFLSRVREYAADEFGAEWTDPDDLAMGLVKIAYGIVVSEDDPDLEQATRNIGIMNVSESKDKGVLYYNTRDSEDLDPLMKAFLFDLHNPWPKLLELNSTHPLTGKRVRRLSAMEGATRFDFDELERRVTVDKRRLYVEFLRDVAVLALPVAFAVGFPLVYLTAVVVGSLPFDLAILGGGWLVTVGLGMVAKTLYKFPRGDPEETTVMELLSDVYASPVNGRLARLDGELIGRGQAGYRFSEDLMFKDETGMMYLKYESWLPFLGNFLFSLRRVPELIGERVTVQGWFLRGTSPWMGLKRLETDDETIRGFIHLGSIVAGGVLALVGVALLVLFGPF